MNFDKGEMITILIYIFMKAEIADLGSQYTFIKDFQTSYVQEGTDGSEVSQNFADFKNSILWLTNIEGDKVENEGPEYIQNVRVEALKEKF